MLWMGLFFLLQESYFLDGTEFILTDGTTIRTAEEISIDALNYTWKEGGDFILIPKTKVRKVNYFSLRVPGRPPKKHYKNIHQRRTTGHSAVYEKRGKTCLRFRHVDFKGRSIEGQIYYNIVTEIGATTEAEPIVLDVDMEQVRPDSVVEFHFFNLEGKPLFTANLDVSESLTKKQRKKKYLPQWKGQVSLVTQLSLDRIGMVEIVSFLKPDREK